VPCRTCLRNQSPIKTLGTEPLMRPVDNISHVLSQLVLKELSTSYVALLGKDFQKVAPGFLQTLPHVSVPLLILLCSLSL